MNSIWFWTCNIWVPLGRTLLLVRLPFPRHHAEKIQWDRYDVHDPHILQIGRVGLLKNDSMDQDFFFLF